jgi:hypothetical protein
MMRSTYNDGSNSNTNSNSNNGSNTNNHPFGLDDDDFAPNPFRSGTDFYEPSSLLQQQQQQHQQHQQQYHIPDPNTGMVGSVMLSTPPPQVLLQQQPLPSSHMMYHHPATAMQPPPQQQQQQQEFPDPSSYLTGTMDQMGAVGGMSSNNNNNNNRNGTAPSSASAPPPTGIYGIFYSLFHACIRYDTLQTLFNVDTIDIYIRIQAVLTKFHVPNYFRVTVLGDDNDINNNSNNNSDMAEDHTEATLRKGPDLYGPFWISMTCMFVLGITANLNDYYRHSSRSSSQQQHPSNNNDASSTTNTEQEFEYDLTHLLHAMYICFSYTFGVSTFFWLVCSCMGMTSTPTSTTTTTTRSSSLSWTMWVCHYGYSLTPIWIGTCMAWWFHYSLYHWLVLAISVSISGLFIVRNLSTPLLMSSSSTTAMGDPSHATTTGSNSTTTASAHAKAAPILLSILAVQFTFLLVLKLTFYS